MSDRQEGASRDPDVLGVLVGDAERDAAVERLTQHHVEGRLTLGEFDERLCLALASRTVGDLDAATQALPATSAPSAARPRHRGPVTWAAVMRHRVGLAATVVTLSGVTAWWIS